MEQVRKGCSLYLLNITLTQGVNQYPVFLLIGQPALRCDTAFF